MLVGLLLTTAAVASAQAITQNLKACATSYDPNVNYFPETISSSLPLSKLTYTYSKNYKTIVNSFSNETVVLYQCGTPKPTVPGATVIIPVPIQNVTIDSTTIVTYLELLGQRNAIKYTTSGTNGYISSPCIQAIMANTPTAIQETDDKNPANQITQIQSTQAYFQYYSSIAANVSNAVTFPASADPGEFGRAEWLGFVGSFFNLEAMANNITNTLVSNYKALSANANQAPFKPIVAWIEYDQAYAGSAGFPATPASWKVNANDWQRNLTTGAGATFFTPPAGSKGVLASTYGVSYTYTKVEDLLADLSSVDIVVDESFYDVNSTDFATSFNDRAEFLGGASAHKFVSNGQIYMYNRQVSPTNGGSEEFEAGTIEINVMLADLISATHPDALPTYTRTFLRNIFNEPEVVVTAKECVNSNAPLELPVVSGFVAPTATALGAVSTGGAAGAGATGASTTSKSGAWTFSGVSGVFVGALALLF
ncbi:hypothetical protein BC830DRAFT_1134802 [Chytriomyces sp. MP71]|nr:hypothetical protein BC830DRAFT_1134802 [Chytriomyces sp. MP71]